VELGLGARPHYNVTPARMLTPQKPQRTPTRHVLIERHFAWHSQNIRRERLAKECLCGPYSTIAAEQKINCPAVPVDGAVEVVPVAPEPMSAGDLKLYVSSILGKETYETDFV